MTCRSHLCLSVLFLLTATVLVKGQVFFVSCNPDIDKSLEVTLLFAQGRYVYIIGCNSTQGEFGGGGVPNGGVVTVTITDCNIQWGVSYVAVLAAQQGVILGADWQDNSMGFTCVRNTASLAANVALSVTPSAATASIADRVDPDPLFKITDDTEDYTGPELTTAFVGQLVRLHMYILVPLRDSFDIWVIQVTVANSEVGPIVLTGVDGAGTLEGCQAKAYFAPVVRIGIGELMIQFNAFFLSPTTTTEDLQDWEATIGVCAGTCPAVDCSGGPFGARRKRDMSNDTTTYEEMHVKGSFRVVPFPGYTGSDVDVTANEGQKSQIEECEVCMQKSVMYAVTTVLVFALIASLAVSCFLFIRARKSRKILREDIQTHGSAASTYKR